MSLSNSAEQDLMLLLFNNTNWANTGDATGIRGSTAAGSWFISLHTADPGEAGSQTTSEATFTSYARVAVARSGAGWTVTSGSAVNAATITFPTCTGGTNTITHFAIGRDTSGAGEIICSGALTTPVVVSVGNPIASFAASALSAVAD
jgi:hypothetical protein